MSIDGAKVRALRTAARLTQQQLAENAGITRQTVIAVESGQQPIRMTARAIAAALGADVQALSTDPT